MKTILVTGASGFIGINLVKSLEEKGYKVKSLNLRLKWSIFDFENINVLIHLAGKAHDLENVSSPELYYEVNFNLTKKLYDVFLNSNVDAFLYMSSVKAVADTVNKILTEDDYPNPQTHYGKSKLMAEKYIINSPLSKGKLFYILRPCMIHGPGNKGNLNLLYKFSSIGIPWPLGAFHNKRSFLSFDNLSFIINELISRNDIDSGIYNLADDMPISTNEIISIISKCRKRNIIILKINPLLVKMLFKICGFLRLPINSNTLRKLTESYCVSNEKILKAIKKDLPLKSIEGIEQTILSFNNVK